MSTPKLHQAVRKLHEAHVTLIKEREHLDPDTIAEATAYCEAILSFLWPQGAPATTSEVPLAVEKSHKDLATGETDVVTLIGEAPNKTDDDFGSSYMRRGPVPGGPPIDDPTGGCGFIDPSEPVNTRDRSV